MCWSMTTTTGSVFPACGIEDNQEKDAIDWTGLDINETSQLAHDRTAWRPCVVHRVVEGWHLT